MVTSLRHITKCVSEVVTRWLFQYVTLPKRTSKVALKSVYL